MAGLALDCRVLERARSRPSTPGAERAGLRRADHPRRRARHRRASRPHSATAHHCVGPRGDPPRAARRVRRRLPRAAARRLSLRDGCHHARRARRLSAETKRSPEARPFQPGKPRSRTRGVRDRRNMMSQEAVRSTARGAPKPVVVGALANFSGTSTRSSPATTRWVRGIPPVMADRLRAMQNLHRIAMDRMLAGRVHDARSSLGDVCAVRTPVALLDHLPGRWQPPSRDLSGVGARDDVPVLDMNASDE